MRRRRKSLSPFRAGNGHNKVHKARNSRVHASDVNSIGLRMAHLVEQEARRRGIDYRIAVRQFIRILSDPAYAEDVDRLLEEALGDLIPGGYPTAGKRLFLNCPKCKRSHASEVPCPRIIHHRL